MKEAVLEKSPLALEFEQSFPHLPAGDVPWVERMRKRSFERFAQTGFPDEKTPGWKFFPASKIQETPWKLFEFPVSARASDLRNSPLFAQEDCLPLSFLNGYYLPDLQGPHSEGFVAANLSALLKNNPERFENFWGHRPVGGLGAFEALNGAFFQDGSAIVLPQGFISPKPIHLFFFNRPSNHASMTHPLNLIALGPRSKAVIVQEYAGEDGVCLTNAVTEIFLDEGAQLDLIVIEREGAGAFHLESIAVHQASHSRFSASSVFMGESSSRQELEVELEGENAECAVNGLYRSNGDQSKNIKTAITHSKPHTRSVELYKGILDERGKAAFEGLIAVKPEAQKTDASLYNKNLILSEEAQVHTSPEFKIEADDVRCKHGSAIGQMDTNALFYLKSRGFGDKEAREALLYAFQSEIISAIPVEGIRLAVLDILSNCVPYSQSESVPNHLQEGRYDSAKSGLEGSSDGL